MMGHKICFNGEMRQIIPKIFLLHPSYLDHWQPTLFNLLKTDRQTDTLDSRTVISDSDDIIMRNSKLLS